MRRFEGPPRHRAPRSAGHVAPWLVPAALAAAGCTSSDGGGDLAPGGGQGPDPVVLDFPIAYVKRPAPQAGTTSVDARRLLGFEPGADLYLRDRASPSAPERNLTAQITQGRGDVRDLEPSWDGRRLLFSMREPLIPGAEPDEQPTWNIWEYDIATYIIGQDVKEPIYDPVLLLLLYYWLCWWMILIAAAALKAAFHTSWPGGFASALVLLCIVFEILTRINVVSDYPFSLGWSEGSRYYYASLFFSKKIYDETFPLSTLHPTRYLLQSFPFLFPSLGLFGHRFWQFLLWIGLTTGASIAVPKRIFSDREKGVRWLTAGWLFLFLLTRNRENSSKFALINDSLIF